jgi:GDP-L-fucose synthase
VSLLDLSEKRVLLTGGGGFLGGHLKKRLEEAGARITAPSSGDCDLRDGKACQSLFEDARPEVVFHCAVDGGGIGYMRANPGSVLTHNTLMNTHVLQGALATGVERFVGVSSACVYPRDASVPMREEDIWTGYPEPSNAAYGLSKRLLMELGGAFHQQHGFSCVFPVPANLYGPGDDFEPMRSHVVAALIRRFVEATAAGQESVEIWGSGEATREFLYVEDCADALLALATGWKSPEPVNVGTGVETSIRELATRIAEAAGYGGRLEFNAEKPDGQPRKSLDLSRLQAGLDWRAQVDLAEGLKRTVAWYCS